MYGEIFLQKLELKSQHSIVKKSSKIAHWAEDKYFWEACDAICLLFVSALVISDGVWTENLPMQHITVNPQVNASQKSPHNIGNKDSRSLQHREYVRYHLGLSIY